jgi:hypothetical protein
MCSSSAVRKEFNQKLGQRFLVDRQQIDRILQLLFESVPPRTATHRDCCKRNCGIKRVSISATHTRHSGREQHRAVPLEVRNGLSHTQHRFVLGIVTRLLC